MEFCDPTSPGPLRRLIRLGLRTLLVGRQENNHALPRFFPKFLVGRLRGRLLLCHCCVPRRTRHATKSASTGARALSRHSTAFLTVELSLSSRMARLSPKTADWPVNPWFSRGRRPDASFGNGANAPRFPIRDDRSDENCFRKRLWSAAYMLRNWRGLLRSCPIISGRVVAPLRFCQWPLLVVHGR